MAHRFTSRAVRLATIGTLVFATTFALPGYAAPNMDALGIKIGSKHKVVLGVGAIMVRVIRIGSDGWVAVEVEEGARNFGIEKGTKFWVNLSAIQAISAPFS